MNTKKERKTLIDLQKQLANPEKAKRKIIFTSIAFYLLALIVVVVGFTVVKQNIVEPSFGVVIGLIGGVFSGLGTINRISLAHWEVISPHLDRDSIENKIKADSQ